MKQELTVDQVKLEVELRGSQSGFVQELAAWIAGKYGVHTQDAARAIELEHEDDYNQLGRKTGTAYGHSQQTSCNRVLYWLEMGENGSGPLQWSYKGDTARFVIAHRTAAAWAMLVGEAYAQKRAEE